ncbi:AraC family transcriptional regulator [Paenibacillus baekrokdamisoli]|uniref:AraC family transcriptional regulator n=1 Tax=Paenibacillus baekrokdamisoli TaxID=1712516 RepID=A0A3G9J643_9BACL|nr:effector binding domain-containing protein [Paenibacillus baekrokdamisoli]MBB3067595.1 AraC family transcriptional regulator [Paenibacillus baekrokdamisoli]BBH19218.1 AraC family transcriptional regulator [Paenibacillus baekrokdamisoli]
MPEIDDIAKAALSSRYHFQRMFHALTGFTVTEYVRNRRLTLAAEELAGTDSKVIDIALKYGYESPEAFAKAFQRLHGVTPSAAKKMDVKLKAFSRISFQIQIKGEFEMNYRIVEQQASTVIGKDVVIRTDPFKEIPEFVEKIWKNGTHDQINEVVGRSFGTLLYGYYFDFKEDGTRRYMMGYELPEGCDAPPGFTVIHVPTQMYAVFESRETMTEDVEIGLEIQNVWRRIYSEWFPSSNFEQVESPCIEKYYWVDDRQVDSICEVWIPVKRKG